MTRTETIQIMAMLGAFYSGGKNNPKVQAEAWHLILGKYPYRVAEQAVLHFAENDTREYATFPTVGKIVAEIKAEMTRIEKPVKEIVTNISYGRDYAQLTNNAKALISEELYGDWLNMNAEEFAYKADALADYLKGNQRMMLESKNEQNKQQR